MNAILNNIMYTVITVLLPLITTYIILLIKKKIQEVEQSINNETTNKYINAALDIICQAVTTVEQTYVDTLKSKGEFSKDAQVEAKTKATNIAKTLITTDIKDAVSSIYGDFEVWLSTEIETYVRGIK